ncbi:MAG: sugar transferase [Candidatus Electrothrix sp. YB6]
MNKKSYRKVLVEDIIGWTDSVLVLAAFILLRKYYIEGKAHDFNIVFHMIKNIKDNFLYFSVLDGGKFLVLFFACHTAVSYTRLNRLSLLENEKWKKLIARLLITVIVIASGLILLAHPLGIIPPDSSFSFCFCLVLLSLFFCTRLPLSAFLRWRKKQRPAKENRCHALIVGYFNPRARLLDKKLSKFNSGYSPIGFADDKDSDAIKMEFSEFIQDEKDVERIWHDLRQDTIVCLLEEFEEYISVHRVDEVFITLPIRSFYEQIDTIITSCRKQGINARLFNELFNGDANDSADRSYGEGYILENLTDFLVDYDFINQSEFHQDIKRAFDVLLSLTALVLLSPVFLAVAGFVFLLDGRPVLSVQERVGLNKRRFKLFQFRTTVRNAGESAPKMTKTGKFLLRTGLDNLPELWNILKGDMSFIGPRPFSIERFKRIQENTHLRRFSVKPGMTGLQQINCGNDVTLEEKMNMDLQYIAEWTPWGDIRILLRTFFAPL